MALVNVLVDGDELVTRPVDPGVQRAIERATTAAHDALVVELAPFGLTPLDIVVPDYEQVVWADEVPIYAQMLRDRQEGK